MGFAMQVLAGLLLVLDLWLLPLQLGSVHA